MALRDTRRAHISGTTCSKIFEKNEEIECDNHPGFQELSDIMDKLVHAGLCKNTKYWSSKD